MLGQITAPARNLYTDCTYRQTVQSSVFSEFICDPEIRRVDGSVQQQQPQSVQADCGSTHASLRHRRSRLPGGRFASLELSSADRQVAANTARVPATTQDCAVSRCYDC